MISRLAPLLLATVALAAGAARAAPSPAQQKLRPGAAGQLCLDCHPKFADELKKAAVHTPVRARQCTGCHNPHAADHGKLLAAKDGASCAQCHATLVPKDARSVHKPAAEGACASCHDPHASANRFVLTKPAGELCASCHKKLSGAAANAKFRHAPVEKDGCTACHLPHASAKSPDLLRADVPALCVRCHKPDRPTFVKKHQGYAVAGTRCTSCHDPHGSNVNGILYDHVHAPVAKEMCAQCHDPAPGGGVKVKAAGAALCNKCHSQQLAGMLDKDRVHRPLLEGQACLTCHNPHAAKQPKLLLAGGNELCGTCHEDTLRRQKLSVTKHQPVQDGECASCHDPHSGQAPLLLKNGNAIETCTNCHDYKAHSAHPIGEKSQDPRNPNLKIDCLSCHRSHGTEYAHMMPFPKTSDLCTKCHQQYRR